jgi:hypothetical protein
MDLFDWLSLARLIRPRLVAVVVAVAFVAFPHVAEFVFWRAVHARAAQITSEFNQALRPMLAHAHHHTLATPRATAHK